MPRSRRPSQVGAQIPPTTNTVETFLEHVTVGKSLLRFRKKQTIFLQGDPADSIYFICKGKVKITVVSSSGKEAVLAILGPQAFFGEGCLVAQRLRPHAATTLEPSILFRVERDAMVEALRQRADFSQKFIGLLVARNMDLEDDLCDRLFNVAEKRLARALLKLGRLAADEPALDLTMPSVSHEVLAEMIGTTRPRVTQFMNRFRELGLIEYNDEIVVHTELLTDLVLHT